MEMILEQEPISTFSVSPLFNERLNTSDFLPKEDDTRGLDIFIPISSGSASSFTSIELKCFQATRLDFGHVEYSSRQVPPAWKFKLQDLYCLYHFCNFLQPSIERNWYSYEKVNSIAYHYLLGSVGFEHTYNALKVINKSIADSNFGTQLLLQIKDLSAQKKFDKALLVLYKVLDEKLGNGEFELCDSFIRQVNVREFPLRIALGILTITHLWRDKLRYRGEFYKKTSEFAYENYKDAKSILAGLE